MNNVVVLLQGLWTSFSAFAMGSFTVVSSFVSSGFTWVMGFFGPKET